MSSTSLKHWWLDMIWCRPVYNLKADAISAFTLNGFAVSMLACVLLYTNIAGLENACHRHEMASMWSCSKHRQGIYHDQLSMQWYSHAIGPVVIGLTLRGWVTHICISKLNIPASNATSGDIVTTLASVATVAVTHPTSCRRWLEIAGSTVCHLTLQRGLRQWTQSVLASLLDRRQGNPRQMAEIRKLRVNLQLLKSK